MEKEKKKAKKARSVYAKSTVTTATNKTRIVELEHINDPCIPEIVCGVPTFDFILTFLSTLAWFLMLASFIVPNWGQVRIMLRDEDELLLDSGLWQVCYRITEVDGNAPRKCRMIENLDERNGEVAAVKESMPMAEINFIRGLYFFVLIVELGISYWPFVGYTTRPHGLLMAGIGHCITGIILLSCIALWESGMLKAYPSTTLELENPILDEIAQDKFLKHSYSPTTMPYVALSSAIIYIVNAFFAFLFCCQVNFDREMELDGNDWLQKITQPNFDLKKSKEAKEKQKQKKEAKLARAKAKTKQSKSPKTKPNRLSESTESGVDSKTESGSNSSKTPIVKSSGTSARKRSVVAEVENESWKKASTSSSSNGRSFLSAPKSQPNNDLDQLAEYLANLESDKVNDLLGEVKVQENPAFDASDYV